MYSEGDLLNETLKKVESMTDEERARSAAEGKKIVEQMHEDEKFMKTTPAYKLGIVAQIAILILPFPSILFLWDGVLGGVVFLLATIYLVSYSTALYMADGIHGLRYLLLPAVVMLVVYITLIAGGFIGILTFAFWGVFVIFIPVVLFLFVCVIYAFMPIAHVQQAIEESFYYLEKEKEKRAMKNQKSN